MTNIIKPRRAKLKPCLSKRKRQHAENKRRCAKRKQRIAKRLDKHNFPGDLSRPMIRETNAHFEGADKAIGTSHGGIELIAQLAKHFEARRKSISGCGCSNTHCRITNRITS